MKGIRLALGALGVLVGLYGAYLLLTRQDHAQVLSAVIWLAAAVVLHDAVLSGLVLAAGALTMGAVPRVARTPVAVGAIVLSTVTLVAVPVLGRFGARSDNPTLLDRPYWLGWSAIAALVVVGVVVATVLRARRGGGAAGRLADQREGDALS